MDAGRRARVAACSRGVGARTRHKAAFLDARDRQAAESGDTTMADPLPTQQQACDKVRILLGRALDRLARAEAAGTLTPTEARVVAELRTEQARKAAAEHPIKPTTHDQTETDQS